MDGSIVAPVRGRGRPRKSASHASTSPIRPKSSASYTSRSPTSRPTRSAHSQKARNSPRSPPRARISTTNHIKSSPRLRASKSQRIGVSSSSSKSPPKTRAAANSQSAPPSAANRKDIHKLLKTKMGPPKPPLKQRPLEIPPTVDRPFFIIQLPDVDNKFKCPECSHDTYKRSNFVQHSKVAHNKEYVILYECIGCKERFEQIRLCMLHVTKCEQVKNVVDNRPNHGQRATRKRDLDTVVGGGEYATLLGPTPRIPSQPPADEPLSPEREGQPPPPDLNTKKAKVIHDLTTYGDNTRSSTAEVVQELANEATSKNEPPPSSSSMTEKETLARQGSPSGHIHKVVVTVPRATDSFFCPICEKEYSRRDRVTKHCERDHGKTLQYTFQCVNCATKFDDLRHAYNHTLTCVPDAADQSIGRVGRDALEKSRASTSRPKSAPHASIGKHFALSKNTQSADAILNTTPNWELIFFTELGRALVCNPDSAEVLVKAVPMIKDITKGVVRQLGYPT